MMVSGQKAAHLALKVLGLPNEIDGTYNKVAALGVHQEELLLASLDPDTSASA